MNQSRDTETTLESRLARSYSRFLKSLQENACNTRPGGSASGDLFINMSPFLPIEVNACFLESALDKHTLDLAGAMYHVLELVIDVPTKKLLAANVIAQEPNKHVQVIGVDIGSIQAPVADALGQHASIAALDDAALGMLLATAKIAKATSNITIPPVDIVRIVDARLHEQLMGIVGSNGIITRLDSIARCVATLLAGCRDGLVRYHPVMDKLAAFMCKAGSAIRGQVIEDVAAAGGMFFPTGSATIVLHTGEGMTVFRAVRSKNGEITIAGFHPHVVEGLLPVVPDSIDALAKRMRHDTGVNVVLILSIAGIVESIATFIDVVTAREHEKNGPALVQSVFESLGLYMRTFKQTWYSRPRVMVTKLFPRFLLRFAKIRLDLPRFLHDRAATSAVSTLLGSLGKDFSFVVCFPAKRDGVTSFKIIDISVKNLVPVGLISIDPAVFTDININSLDASNLAQTVHARLDTTAPVASSRFVLVIGPKVAAAVASAWKTMFRRIAWNPFALFNLLKRCRDPHSLGLHPMPQIISDLLTAKPKDVARRLSRAFSLKY